MKEVREGREGVSEEGRKGGREGEREGGRPRGSPRIGACLHGSCMAPRGMAGLPGPRFTAAITGPCRGPLSRVSARRACGRSRRRASMQDHLARSPQAGACHPGWNTAQSATTPRPVSRCTMGATGSWTGRSSRARALFRSVASGSTFHNLGERKCEVMAGGSLQAKRITFQVAKLRRHQLLRRHRHNA